MGARASAASIGAVVLVSSVTYGALRPAVAYASGAGASMSLERAWWVTVLTALGCVVGLALGGRLWGRRRARPNAEADHATHAPTREGGAEGALPPSAHDGPLQDPTALLDASEELVASAEATGTLTYVNPAGRQLLGIEADSDVTNLTLADLVPEPLLGRLFEEVLPDAERKGRWCGELALRARTGDVIPVYQVVLGHRGERGVVTSYAVLARDLRDRITLEQALGETEEQLRHAQKMGSLGRLAGSIAHDLNNLITILLGASDLALLKLEPEHRARDEILELQRASERAARLAQQFLSFSRKQASEPSVLDLNATITGLGDLLRRLLGPRVVLEQRLAEDLHGIRADKGQIEQVILNLVVNANDAMPEGGALVIESGNVQISAEEAVSHSAGDEAPAPGTYCRLTVRDTGIGMGARTQARAFEPFFTTKAAGKGTGLGLSTVYGIVKQNGGFVSVASKKNAGTTFQVHFPAVLKSGHAVSAHAERRPLRGSSETILLVESDEAVRDMIRRVLVEHGYPVLSAADSETALSLAERYSGPIQLLLCDALLAGQPARDLAAELSGSREGLRVLFMTGDAALDGPDDAPNLQGRVVRKPFSPRTLIEQVRDALDAPPVTLGTASG